VTVDPGPRPRVIPDSTQSAARAPAASFEEIGDSAGVSIDIF
jgi:hypothetical protein